MSEMPGSSTKQLTDWADDLLVCLRFSTRLPLPRLAFERPAESASLARSASMLPVAGALIGCAAAIILWICIKLGLPSVLAALLAIASLVILTGGLHEDGLTDFADSLGGASAEQRLAIMKDSRIGSYGGLALILSILARVSAIDMLSIHSLGLACTVLIAVAASSRFFALLPLYLLVPARAEGLGAASTIEQEDLVIAGAATLIINLLPLLAGASVLRIILALILSGVAAYGMTLWSRRLIAGQTGDSAGATQQIAEVTSYLVFTAQP